MLQYVRLSSITDFNYFFTKSILLPYVDKARRISLVKRYNNNNNFNSPFHLRHQAIANYGLTHTSVRNSSGIANETTK